MRHSQHPRVFVSFSHKDDAHRARLDEYLAPLKRERKLIVWHDRKLVGGEEFASRIDAELERADIVLLLVTATFLNSEYCYEIEMKRALEHHESGQATVIPIIVEPCDWQRAPFGKLQALPRDGKPVTEWARPRRAWLNVAEGIRQAIEAREPRTPFGRRHAVGERVGSYTLRATLGSADTTRAYHADDGHRRPVALKFLPPEVATDAARLARFRRETETLQQLRHPHIGAVHEVGRQASEVFLAREFVDGRTFREIADDAPSIDGIADIAVMFGQAALALQAAHDDNVVHGGIKPENLMRAHDGHVRVLDFGLATPGMRGMTSPQTSGLVLEPFPYGSPEQVLGQPTLTPATDVFSLGVVLFELVTGRHPFSPEPGWGADLYPDMHEFQRLCEIVVSRPPSPQRLNVGVPDALDALIRRMLSRQPSERPSCREVAETMERLSGDRPPEPGARPAPTLVGRDRERHALRGALDRARAGEASVAMVVGDAGCGKTALVEQFLDELQWGGEEIQIGCGRCDQHLEGTGGYLPAYDLLKSLVHGRTGPDAARALERLAPSWHARVMPSATTRAAAPEATALPSSPERLNQEFLSVLDTLGQHAPILLFLDDLQWADASTLDLLLYVHTHARRTRLLIVGAYRDRELPDAARPFTSAMASGTATGIVLPPLTQRDIEEYVEREYSGHRFPREFIALLHRQTGGLPRFVVHELRYLRERNLIRRSDGCWELVPSVEELADALPESMQRMIERKLDTLDDDQRQLLLAGSIQGETFDAAVVARALKREPSEVEAQLDTIERRHAVIRYEGTHTHPGGKTVRYQFVDGPYRDELHRSLSPEPLAHLSRAVADALVAMFGAHTTEISSQLALLYENARDLEKAATHYADAARHAGRLCAFREGIDLGTRGLRLLDELSDGTDREQLEIDLRFAKVISLIASETHGSPRVVEVFERVRDLSERRSDRRSLFAAYGGLFWSHMTRGDIEVASEVAQEFLGLATPTAEDDFILEGHFVVGAAAAQQGDFDGARSHLGRVLTLYDHDRHRHLSELFNSNPAVHAGAELAFRLHEMGRFDDARARIVDAVDVGRRAGHALSVSMALMLGQSIMLLRGERGQARRWFDEWTEGLSAHPSVHQVWVDFYRGWARAAAAAVDQEGVDAGAIDGGIGEMRRTLTGLADCQMKYSVPVIRAHLAGCLLDAGRVDEAVHEAEAAARDAEHAGNRHCLAELLRVQGEGVARSDDTRRSSEAHALLQRSLELARRQGAGFWELRAAIGLARWLKGHGKLDAARHELATTCRQFEQEAEIPDLATARSLLIEYGGERLEP